MIKKLALLGLMAALLLALTACTKPEAKPPVNKAPVEEKKEEPLLENLEDEARAQLIEKVRTYAEVFDLDAMDKTLRAAIKDELPSGSDAADSKEAIIAVVEPLMAESIKAKIAEGLMEYTQQAAEEDIELIYSYMNTGELINFVASYEIQRLKQEGYLR